MNNQHLSDRWLFAGLTGGDQIEGFNFQTVRRSSTSSINFWAYAINFQSVSTFRVGQLFKWGAYRAICQVDRALHLVDRFRGVQRPQLQRCFPAQAFRVSGFGFRVLGFGCRVSGFGFRVWGFGLRVSGLGRRVQGLGFRVQGSGFRVQGSGFRVQGSGFRNQGSGFRVQVQSSGFRVQGFSFECTGEAPTSPPKCTKF